MTHPPEPIPDLDADTGARCPQCDGHPHWDNHGWRCDHCRITWTPDGTGGEQT